jgi:type II secretory pathway pseudopilin PulG
MSLTPPKQTTTDPQPKSSSESWYYLVAGVLLVMVLTILAILWLRERKSRIAFQDAAQALRQENQNLRAAIQSNLAAALPSHLTGQQATLDWDRVELTTARLDDKTVNAFEVQARDAKALAKFLKPGTILIVVPDQEPLEPRPDGPATGDPDPPAEDDPAQAD